MTKNKKKILVVEDVKCLMEAMAAGLLESGFTVLRASNGKEGLEVALREHPDLILLDVIMPVMDGTEMLKRLRKDQWGKSANVVFLTVLNDLSNIQAAIEGDVANYLMKQDWKIEDIVARVRQMLKMD
jgi:CheY-like chemotaxis protein